MNLDMAKPFQIAEDILSSSISGPPTFLLTALAHPPHNAD